MFKIINALNIIKTLSRFERAFYLEDIGELDLHHRHLINIIL